MEERGLRLFCGRIGGFSLMRAVWFGALSFLCVSAVFGQQSVPDAPTPQAQSQPQSSPPNAPAPQPSNSLDNLTSQVAPGKGTGAPDENAEGEKAAGQTAPKVSNGTVNEQTPPPDSFQGAPPIMPPAGQAPPSPSEIPTLHTGVTVVDVPVIVRDKHNNLVAGLPWWRFRVYQDGVRQRIAFFTTDAYPLSIAFVIDATLPADIMHKVNQSFSAVANSLTPADSVAVISYTGTGPDLITDFTGAAGARLPAALEQAKRPGQEMGVPDVGGPMTSGPTVNGEQADPTLAPVHGNANNWYIPARSVHPLNDAILYAAEQLASQPRGRRRIIYVVSDGQNVRSKATQKQVLEYLLTNNISVYGTEVGNASLWGIGYLDRAKLPFLQPDNVLPRYALATGGDMQAEMTENGIQNAFVHITESVRTAYTIDYTVSSQGTLSGKYHNIDVRVEGLPGLTVDAKQGYYPSASSNDF